MEKPNRYNQGLLPTKVYPCPFFLFFKKINFNLGKSFAFVFLDTFVKDAHIDCMIFSYLSHFSVYVLSDTSRKQRKKKKKNLFKMSKFQSRKKRLETN